MVASGWTLGPMAPPNPQHADVPAHVEASMSTGWLGFTMLEVGHSTPVMKCPAAVPALFQLSLFCVPLFPDNSSAALDYFLVFI